MSDFWLTFTLSTKDYGGKTRDQRYAALLEEIQSIQDTAQFRWEEPTSFMIFRTKHSIDGVVEAVKRAIALPHDVVLIHDVGKKLARVVGAVEDIKSLQIYMSYVKPG